MKRTRLGATGPETSRLAYGCMRIAGDGSTNALRRGKRAVRAAVDAGYTLFDHADIYAAGGAESLFGEVLDETPGLRDNITLLTKCGVRFAGDTDDRAPNRYDLSARHMLDCVDGSLRRLRTDSIDVLLLHRPDFLADFAEMAEAFETLYAAGKVRHFGVSNFSPSQVRLLRAETDRPLVANQVEINLHNIDALTDGTLDQCVEFGMTPQAWCPVAVVAYPAWGNTLSDADTARVLDEVNSQSERYGIDRASLALSWLLRHPSGISPIVGSTTPARIAAVTRALSVDYRRDDWYRLLEARMGRPVP